MTGNMGKPFQVMSDQCCGMAEMTDSDSNEFGQFISKFQTLNNLSPSDANLRKIIAMDDRHLKNFYLIWQQLQVPIGALPQFPLSVANGAKTHNLKKFATHIINLLTMYICPCCLQNLYDDQPTGF